MNTKSSVLKGHGCKEVNGNLRQGTYCILLSVATSALKGPACRRDWEIGDWVEDTALQLWYVLHSGKKKMTFIKSH